MEKETNSFSQGLRDGMPICLGYLSVAFAFGIFTVSHGLTAWEAVMISMTNVTSAGQLAAVPIIAGGGSLFELALTQFVINMRYSLMSVSLSQKLGKSVRLIDRFLISFVNTDEVFAVAISKGAPLGRKYLYGLTLTPYLGWSLGTLLGAGRRKYPARNARLRPRNRDIRNVYSDNSPAREKEPADSALHFDGNRFELCV